ncbi:thiopeptide-type bacteriocin biosynthesis protein [Streptomyces sp. NRRL B-24720]|uniref:thiopeptide-type bacteriocin biosynthesis protein n=1 Tax=Streptomyces sp. NRRL B-24720 TaxID=1476876 RepID=UPI00068ECA74|nr:thiopeptide-type bacteriocin biosynthesis protein [Streptomyces sp. NRRL B-24720]
MPHTLALRQAARTQAPRMPLPDLFRKTADLIDGQSNMVDDEIFKDAESIVSAALNALHQPERPEWVEYRLVQNDDQVDPRLYAALAACARQLLAGDAEDFFFMHKSPGLRVRFRLPVPASRRSKTVALLELRVAEWEATGLISGWSRAVYEPEQHLFGGPVSMKSVHRLFTADSLAWLDFWATTTSKQPAWAFSLLMIEAFFDELEIVGWEDRDVWDRLRRQAQRTYPGNKPEGWSSLCEKIQRVWSEPGRISNTVEPWAITHAKSFREEVRIEYPHWSQQYFQSSEAYVGPREAAAFFIVYHWNRARLPFVWQCAISEALVR